MNTGSAITILFLVTASSVMPALAGDEMVSPVQTSAGKDEKVDCTKQVWPNISPSCLRSNKQTTEVRLITVNRHYPPEHPSALLMDNLSIWCSRKCFGREGTAMRNPGPFTQDDMLLATVSGLLAWIITLFIRTAFGG